METDIFMKNKKIKGKCFRDLLILLVNFLRIQVKKRTLKSKEIVTVKLYIQYTPDIMNPLLVNFRL
jgi:hypothetical protein